MSFLIKRVMFSTVLVLATVSSQAQPARSMAPEAAAVYIASPANGAVVPGTFVVEFGLSGMGVAPSGVERDNTGHHHLLVDGMTLPDLSMALGESVIHFGGGQTQTTLTLPPGTHTLQLILGDYLHVPHQPPVVSEVVTITVVN